MVVSGETSILVNNSTTEVSKYLVFFTVQAWKECGGEHLGSRVRLKFSELRKRMN